MFVAGEGINDQKIQKRHIIDSNWDFLYKAAALGRIFGSTPTPVNSYIEI